MPPKPAADGERKSGAFSAGLDLLDLICTPVRGERTEDAVKEGKKYEYVTYTHISSGDYVRKYKTYQAIKIPYNYLSIILIGICLTAIIVQSAK